MDKKTTGIVAYITWVGWIIAIVAGDREGARFHLNQALTVNLFSLLVLALRFIPFVGWILSGLWSVCILILGLLGLVYAVNGEDRPVPLLGHIHILS